MPHVAVVRLGYQSVYVCLSITYSEAYQLLRSLHRYQLAVQSS
jgi:hypothetical protein